MEAAVGMMHTDESTLRDVVERALTRLFATSDRINMLRRQGDGRWTAQVLVAGVRRLAVVCHSQGLVVGVGLADMNDLAPTCREAMACYATHMSPRLRQHALEITGGEVMLVGRAGMEATEQQVLDLVAGAIAVCAMVAEHLGGLRDQRVAEAYLQIRGQGG